MSGLLSIASCDRDAGSAAHQIEKLPVLVIFPHNQCNCRCVMCDIWRIREAQEITPRCLEQQLNAIRKLDVRWVVFSGGEPQLNRKWSELAQMFRTAGIRVTLLTAGLLLQSEALTIAKWLDDVIVSLDGPPSVHDKIRRVPNAFERLSSGVRALHQIRPEMPVRGRCTVQRANHQALRAAIESAKDIGLLSISFLAADFTSSAFNRPQGWSPDRVDRVALTGREVDELEAEIELLIDKYAAEIQSRFVVESPEKLRRIVRHFRAQLQQMASVAPRCNAPWVSAVIESSGDVRPCFFHPSQGNIHRQSLPEIINGPQAVQFRSNLDISTNPICRNCVCSLYIPDRDVSAV